MKGWHHQYKIPMVLEDIFSDFSSRTKYHKEYYLSMPQATAAISQIGRPSHLLRFWFFQLRTAIEESIFLQYIAALFLLYLLIWNWRNSIQPFTCCSQQFLAECRFLKRVDMLVQRRFASWGTTSRRTSAIRAFVFVFYFNPKPSRLMQFFSQILTSLTMTTTDRRKRPRLNLVY